MIFRRYRDKGSAIREEEHGQFGAVRCGGNTPLNARDWRDRQAAYTTQEVRAPGLVRTCVLGPARAAEEIAAGRLVRNGDAAA